MFSFESLELPVVAAPMAGGPTTTELVIDASKAGGWGVLAGGNKDVDTMAREVRDVQDAGVAAGVNLFIPGPQSTDAEALAGLREKLGPIAKKFDVELGEPSWDDDDYGAKLDWLVNHPVDVVTFTFGLPSAEDVTALRGVGTSLGAMVTSPEDARAAVERGMTSSSFRAPTPAATRARSTSTPSRATSPCRSSSTTCAAPSTYRCSQPVASPRPPTRRPRSMPAPSPSRPERPTCAPRQPVRR